MEYNFNGNVFDNHPELKEYEEFNHTSETAAKWFEYIYLVYSNHSDIFGIDDIIERKQTAFKRTGLPKEHLEGALANSNEELNKKVTKFFKMQNEGEIELLLSGKEAFHILLAEVRTSVSDELDDNIKAIALKAKRVCFEDAFSILDTVKKIQNKLKNENTDISSVLDKVDDSKEWKAGWVESLIDKK